MIGRKQRVSQSCCVKIWIPGKCKKKQYGTAKVRTHVSYPIATSPLLLLLLKIYNAIETNVLGFEMRFI